MGPFSMLFNGTVMSYYYSTKKHRTGQTCAVIEFTGPTLKSLASGLHGTVSSVNFKPCPYLKLDQGISKKDTIVAPLGSLFSN